MAVYSEAIEGTCVMSAEKAGFRKHNWRVGDKAVCMRPGFPTCEVVLVGSANAKVRWADGTTATVWLADITPEVQS